MAKQLDFCFIRSEDNSRKSKVVPMCKLQPGFFYCSFGAVVSSLLSDLYIWIQILLYLLFFKLLFPSAASQGPVLLFIIINIRYDCIFKFFLLFYFNLSTCFCKITVLLIEYHFWLLSPPLVLCNGYCKHQQMLNMLLLVFVHHQMSLQGLHCGATLL